MMKKINKVEKSLLIMLVLTIALMQGMSCSVVSANNYKDTTYNFYDDGSGSDYATNMRPKMDGSASYVNNNGTNTTSISVAVAGSKTYEKYAPTANCDYITNYYTVKKGNRRYFKNSMYPRCKYAYLLMATSNHSKHTIAGKWSPDNCSGY